MRNLSCSSETFCSNVKSQIRYCDEFFLRTSALVSSKRLEKWTNRILLKSKDSTTLALLAIASWQMDPDIAILLHFELRELIESNDDLDWLRFLIQSETHCYLWLLETKKWSTREFFGNICTKQQITKALKSMKFEFQKTSKPTRVQRRRGYKDKGSLKKVSPNQFIDFTAEQKELERKRESLRNTYLLLQGFLE